MRYYMNNDYNILNFGQSHMVAEDTISPFYFDITGKIKLYHLDTFSFFSNIPDQCCPVNFYVCYITW